jgi:beta-glucosidase
MIATIGIGGKTRVSVEAGNTGKVRGDEVVQLYIRDEVSSVTPPYQGTSWLPPDYLGTR